jgi:hypothetical protein
MPRLTAVAPMLTNEKEEHQATMLVDGGAPFDDATNPGDKPAARNLNVRNPPGHERPEVPTDPGRPPVARPPGFSARPGPPVATQNVPARRLSGAVPPVMMETSGTSPTLSSVPNDTSPTLAPVAPGAYGSRMAPVNVVEGTAPSLPALQPVGGNRNLIIGLAIAAAVLLVGIVAVVALKPPPKGLVMIVVPDDAAGKARLNINGEDLTEPDGSPLKTWPQMRQVPVGKATVMITAPGYEPFVETLEVTGDDPAQLSKPFKKK